MSLHTMPPGVVEEEEETELLKKPKKQKTELRNTQLVRTLNR